MKLTPLVFALSVLCPAALAQETGKKTITSDSFKLPQWGGYRLSPDNSKIAFHKRDRDEDGKLTPSHVFIYDIATRQTMRLTSSAGAETSQRWIEDDKILFWSNRQWRTISLQGGEGIPLFEDKDARNVGALSEDLKKILYIKRTERPDKEEWDEKVKNGDDGYYAGLPPDTFIHLWVYDGETKEHRQITEGDLGINTEGAWSPDGEWIAFTSDRTGTLPIDPTPSNDSNIWIVSAEGGPQRQLTTNPGPDQGPVFSPDGSLIAYSGSVHENSMFDQLDVWVIPFGGGKATNLTEAFDYSCWGPQWSPDGRFIYFSAAKGVSSHLYRVSPDGGKISMVLPDVVPLTRPSLSDDGTKWIFTGISLYETGEVFIANVDGTDIRNVLSPNNHLGEFEIARSEVLTWKGADDWDIQGILTYPLGYEEGQRYPLFLQINGGNSRYSKTFNSDSQIWAARGYAVLLGNPRGSSGRTYEFSNAHVMDYGGKDFIDIMRGVDHVIEMGVADPEMMVIMGSRYGGFMTFWTVTQTDRFKAAIGHAGISNWYSALSQTGIPNLALYMFGSLSRLKEFSEKFSPIEYADNIKTPLLIVHGEQDRGAPISQAQEFFFTLRMLGKDVEFLRYPREGHGIREEAHRKHLEQEQVKWFKRYLFPDARR